MLFNIYTIRKLTYWMLSIINLIRKWHLEFCDWYRIHVVNRMISNKNLVRKWYVESCFRMTWTLHYPIWKLSP